MHSGYVGAWHVGRRLPGARSSPRRRRIKSWLAAAQSMAAPGLLFIVKNYTGDVLNFAIAAELNARSKACRWSDVLIHDDVAVQDSLYTAGRRGVGATVLAEKICGAVAETGHAAGAGGRLGRKVSEQGRSMGMALTSCTVPAVRRPTFVVED
jgi:dihydroxyacetone kinase-like protein